MCVSEIERLKGTPPGWAEPTPWPFLSPFDRLKVGSGGVPREQKMLKGHLPRVIYHQVY